MSDAPQSYSHHTRWDPPFHFFVMPVIVLAALTAIVLHLFIHFQPHPLHGVLITVFAIAFVMMLFKIRLYALKVQDRVIRLEERLRLATLLPEPLRARIPELSVGQLVALRFASDAELPALAQKAMNEKLSPDAIKKSIQNWRPDNWRV
jgi:Family of unknown function (DUF6526)